MDWAQTIFVGAALGSVYALSGTGIILTYRATGIFNFAHFVIALLGAYVLWQLNGVWGWPLLIAAPLVILVMGPAIGLILERLVFRSLQQRRASTSEKLVATLGVTVLLLGVINLIWGPSVRGTTSNPVPRLFGAKPIEFAGVRGDTQQLGWLITVVVVSLVLYALFRYTFLGTRIRAVVDRRELAELAGIDANRVSALAWAMGSTLAVLTGVLIAPPALEPFRILFLGIEMFSVAVIARLVSLPIALAAGVLLLGVGKSILAEFQPFGASGTAADLYVQLVVNLSTVLLFVVLVAYRRLDEIGDSGPTGRGLVAGSLGRAAGRLRGRSITTATVIAAGVVLLPLLLDDTGVRRGTQMLALAVVFLSIVAITGFSGHITLGQASFAGLGAFFTARAVNAWHLPVLLAMLCGAGAAVLSGLIAGWPALKRKGLFLGLTTLAIGLMNDRFVFNSTLFSGGAGGLVVKPPSLFGWRFDTPRSLYFFEVVVVLLMLLLANNLRSGRLGRILAAMRDSETATRSIGINLRAYKLFIFAASAFMAGIGGAMLAQAQGAWDVTSFNPLYSLFWFTAVIVFGVSSLYGALLAAVVYVMLPLVFNADTLSVIGLFGFAALFLGRLPNGLVGLLGRLPDALTAGGRRAFARVRREAEPVPEPELPALTPFAERILAEREREAATL